MADRGIQCGIHYEHPLHRISSFARSEQVALPVTETAPGAGCVSPNHARSVERWSAAFAKPCGKFWPLPACHPQQRDPRRSGVNPTDLLRWPTWNLPIGGLRELGVVLRPSCVAWACWKEFKSCPAIDVGCGTGGNLKWLQQRFRPIHCGDSNSMTSPLSMHRSGAEVQIPACGLRT